MANKLWPPVAWLWKQHKLNAAWYSGLPDRLRGVSAFWSSDEKCKVHVPIAADLAALAAGQVFSGSPTITHEDERTNARLQELLEQTGFFQLLLQAAELAAVYGGVFLKLNWDSALTKRPIVSVLAGDEGLPSFRLGINTENVFWSVERADEQTGAIWRCEERYTSDGEIISTLYKGSEGDLGTEQPLNSIPETLGRKRVAQSGTHRLLSVYIPNRLPNRAVGASHYGASDYEGLYGLFSALDEAQTCLLRDIRLCKTRVIVPVEYLRKREEARIEIDSRKRGGEWTFSLSDEVFTALDMDPSDSQDRVAQMMHVQPEIRAEQLLRAIDDIKRTVYLMAGYSPQSAGLDIQGEAESGTALNVRERRSMQTAEAKKTYWWHALVDFAGALLALDAEVFHTGVKADDKITVTFADATQPDMQTIADTLDKIERARAASTLTKVRLLHPDWSDEDVAEEVALIKEEGSLPDPDAPPEASLGDEEDDPPTEDGDT